MIGRMIWFASLAGLAAVTTILQLDRQSDLNPALASSVPEGLGGYAQLQIALKAVEADDRPAALEATETLVRLRPMPAEHLTLLASAQAKAGRIEAAGFTIQMAGRRGWRDPVAQETVLRLALVAGDKAEAARRYAALLRREKTPDELLITLGSEVFGEPAGAAPETMATIIAGSTRWHSRYLQRGLQLMPPAAFAEVTRLALERGARFECQPLEQAVGSLRQRDPAAAEKLAETARRRCV